ncbi:MAG: hypothetical protein FWE98_04470 [Oscillospiraceae bacterium]|nr:hypothetical protein [Oscillospiraceae bacterium]
MKTTKRILSTLLALLLLLAVLSPVASAARPLSPMNAQLVKLLQSQGIVITVSVLEASLARVPLWLNWAVFAKGSSYEAMDAELQAELDKAGLDLDALLEWQLAGELEQHEKEVLAFYFIMLEKGPEIIKKHCVFYIDWLFDGLVWSYGLMARGLIRVMPLFA